MARAPFQVLVLPYQISQNQKSISYALFRRSDAGYWQGIAGGGEEGETALEAARREAAEEAGIGMADHFLPLDTKSSIPVENVCGFLWGNDVWTIPEYSFGVFTKGSALRLSNEHSECVWVPLNDALALLHWQSNKDALQELDRRLQETFL